MGLVAAVLVAPVVLAVLAVVALAAQAVVAILLEELGYPEMELVVVESVDSELVDELEQLVAEDLTSSSQHRKKQTHSE